METRVIVQPVSMLFNINRESADGRSIQEYTDWSKSLVQIFPNLFLFHDGIFDYADFGAHLPNQLLLHVNELSISKRRKEIERICTKYLANGKMDLVYKLPDYGIVTSSKFELLERVMSYINADYYLWVDIGITRFLQGKILNPIQIDNGLFSNYSSCFEADLKGNIDFFRYLKGKGLLRSPKTGSSRRIIGTGAFLIRKDYVSLYSSLIRNKLDSWLANDEWDTEQVAIGQLLSEIPYVSLHKQKRNTPTSFLDSLISNQGLKLIDPRVCSILFGRRDKQALTKI